MTYVDWTTYTKSGCAGNTDITLVGTPANEIDFDAWRNDDGALWKDYGSGHFGNFEHLIEVINVSQNNAYANADVEVVMNATPPIYANPAGQEVTRVRLYQNKIYLTYWNGSANSQDAMSTNVTNSTRYYLTIKRTGSTWYVYIRTGSHTGTLVDTLTLTGSSTAYRYLYNARVPDSGDAWERVVEIYNLDLQETVTGTRGFQSTNKGWW